MPLEYPIEKLEEILLETGNIDYATGRKVMTNYDVIDTLTSIG